MTPCEKLGYKVGDRFVVTDPEKNVSRWSLGTIIILHKDDGTYAPGFRKIGELWNHDFVYLDGVKPVEKKIKTGDTIERDGKKYRVTLKEIPQYDFKPGMLCRVIWGKGTYCGEHSSSDRVVFLNDENDGSYKVAYANTYGSISTGYVNTSNIYPE